MIYRFGTSITFSENQQVHWVVNWFLKYLNLRVFPHFQYSIHFLLYIWPWLCNGCVWIRPASMCKRTLVKLRVISLEETEKFKLDLNWIPKGIEETQVPTLFQVSKYVVYTKRERQRERGAQLTSALAINLHKGCWVKSHRLLWLKAADLRAAVH